MLAAGTAYSHPLLSARRSRVPDPEHVERDRERTLLRLRPRRAAAGVTHARPDLGDLLLVEAPEQPAQDGESMVQFRQIEDGEVVAEWRGDEAEAREVAEQIVEMTLRSIRVVPDKSHAWAKWKP